MHPEALFRDNDGPGIKRDLSAPIETAMPGRAPHEA